MKKTPDWEKRSHVQGERSKPDRNNKSSENRTDPETHADKRIASKHAYSSANMVARETPTGLVGPKRRPVTGKSAPPLPGPVAVPI